MAGEKIDTKIKKKEKQAKQIMEFKDINYKEWYLQKLNEFIEDNLDSIFELIVK